MKLTKTALVLKKLRYAGEMGVHSFDLIQTGGLRAAARINDLRNQGFAILSRAEKKGSAVGCRYFLRET